MHTSHTNKKTALLRTAMVLICVVLLAVLGMGCDDEESFESRLEEAKIAIDDGNYTKAIDILDGMTGQEVLEVRASAYAGQVGIDTFEILSQLDDGDSDGNDGSIDLIGKMLGTGTDDNLTCEAIAGKRVLLSRAMDALILSAGGDEQLLDNEGKTQLAIYGLTDLVLIVGQIVCREYLSGNPDATIILTESWIGGLLGELDPTQITDEEREDANIRIRYIQNAIEALDDGNDLAEEFAAFKNEITRGDDSVSTDDLIAYINAL